MFSDTKVPHPCCAGGLLTFDVLLGNSLADKNAMGFQTCYPVRLQELRISQLKCNSDLEASQLRLHCCSAATRGRIISG